MAKGAVIGTDAVLANLSKEIRELQDRLAELLEAWNGG